MSNTGGDNRLISTASAAAYLGVSTRSLREHYSEWGIPAVRLGPRTLQFRVSALDKFTRDHAA